MKEWNILSADCASSVTQYCQEQSRQVARYDVSHIGTLDKPKVPLSRAIQGVFWIAILLNNRTFQQRETVR